jgi:hypothetical protein
MMEKSRLGRVCVWRGRSKRMRKREEREIAEPNAKKERSSGVEKTCSDFCLL